MNSLSVDFVQLCVAPASQKKDRWLFWLWAGLLFIGGALVWGYFFNWGYGPFTFHDWVDITIPRMAFLRSAIRQGVLPLHIADGFPLGGVTDRYLTIPDLLLSPQVLLLNWLGIFDFLAVNFLLLYAAGCAGLAWVCRKHHLSALTLTILFLLFNFNGHLLAHFSVGHYTWVAYFLFPWLIGLVLDLFQKPGDWSWVLKTSGLLLIMLLQGGYHQYIWSLFLLALLILALPRQYKTLCFTLVFSVLLGMARLLPAVLNLGKFDNQFIAGYPFVHNILFALTDVYIPNDFTLNLGLTEKAVGTWEYASYVGILGMAFLAWFGGYLVFRNRQRLDSFQRLYLPALGLCLLSIDRVYQYLREVMPLPLFTGERVSSRIFVLAFLLILFLAAIEFQRWLDAARRSWPFVLGCLGVTVLAFNDLWQNLRLWKIPAAAATFTAHNYNPARWAVVTRPDSAYTTVLWIGLAVSCASLAGLALLAYWEKQDQKHPFIEYIYPFRFWLLNLLKPTVRHPL